MAWHTWLPYLVSAGATVAVLTAGGLLTEIGPWYYELRKPSWQPPDWLFGPAWTTIGILTAWSAAIAWRHAPGGPERWVILSLFALNGMLNVGWSLFFFKWHRPDWALMEVVPLWLSVLLLVLETGSITARAGLLLLPYLLWVTFAAVLNRAIVQRNVPFA